MSKYDKVTDEQFDNELTRILSKMKASQLLDLPGVYEIVREEYNNQILEALCPDVNEDEE